MRQILTVCGLAFVPPAIGRINAREKFFTLKDILINCIIKIYIDKVILINCINKIYIVKVKLRKNWMVSKYILCQPYAPTHIDTS